MRAPWILLLLLTALGSRAQIPERYSLRGKLVDGSSGQPLAGVHVVLTKEHGQSPRPQVSGPDGAVNFTDLEADRYFVDAIVDGETILFNEFPDGAALNVWVGPDRKTQDFVFPVKPHATISGTVRDEFGDPMANARVIAYREDWRNGRTVMDPIANEETDDRGRYRILNLVTAKYLICASPSPGRNDLAPQAEEGDFGAISEPRILIKSCFPGQAPNTFRIDLGEQKTIDFKLSSLPSVQVQGTVSPALQQGSVTLAPIDFPGMPSQTGSLQNGRFEFKRVAPGRYRLETGTYQTQDPHRATAVEQITVDKSRLSGIQLALQASASVDLAVEGAADLKGLQPGSIGLQPADQETANPSFPYNQVFQFPVADGNGHIDGLQPGRYWLVKRMNEPNCVESATVDGEDVLSHSFNIAPGASAHLRVKLTTQCASFSGVVMSRGKPAYMARIAVLVSGTPKQPGDVYIYSTNETGEFTLTLLPPGRYLIWAWQQDHLYTGPSRLADAEKSAVMVDLRQGQKVSGLVVRDLEEATR